MAAVVPTAPQTQSAHSGPLAAAVEAAEQAYAQDRFDAAAQQAAELVPAARAHAHPHLLGRALLVLASAQLRRLQLLPAYSAAVEAQDLLGAAGDMPRRLAAAGVSAGVLMDMGENARALELVRRAVAEADAHGFAQARLTLLLTLTTLLFRGGEVAASVQTLQEALQLTRDEPALRAMELEVASRLAMARIDFVWWLTLHDRPGDAAVQRKLMESSLPPLDLSRWRSFSHSERAALRCRIFVLARLGRRAEARAAAAIALRLARGPHRLLLPNTYRALGSLHADAGNHARALAYAQRSVRQAQAVGNHGLVTNCRRDQLEMHEVLGQWRQALELQRALGRNGYMDRQRDTALRCRLAAMERQEERQRHQARQERLHGQRLALIGRLIGQTHDALSEPIERVRDLVQRARDSRDPAEQLRRLGELNTTIDRATALVSQLKLFSYRSSPQLMALSLRDALLQAWEGLAPHLGTRAVRLHAEPEPARLAWADAQRLGILLKVLLIELIQRRGATTLRARVLTPREGDVALELQTPASAAAPADGAPSIGLALCEEIAAEMGGTLRSEPGADGTGPRPLLVLRTAPAERGVV